jgi:hypothetical protein
LELARRAEEDRQRALRDNDEGRRALQKMMDGTLKTKKDLSALEVTIEKEEWMLVTPVEEMTEAQLQALADYELKRKALAEEQDRYSRQLDNEMRKLKGEVADLLQGFNSKVKSLREMRHQNDLRLHCQELVSVRLALAELQVQEDKALLDRLVEEECLTADLVNDAKAEVGNAERELAGAVAGMHELIKKEKDLVQEFKPAMANVSPTLLEPDALAQLTRLFRQRATLRKKRGVEQKDVGQQEDLHWDHPVLKYPDDCPEGVEEVVWRKMIELRHEKYKTDVEIQRRQLTVEQLESRVKYQGEILRKCEEVNGRLAQQLTEHASAVWTEAPDLEVMLKLRQGQVNVLQAPVVTDYSDALVLHSEVVEMRNRHILQLAKEKIDVLRHIKDFRKKISLVEWEHKLLALKIKDVNERSKDVQMLRVTKDLQSLLKNGEDGSKDKTQADMLERMIEHLTTSLQRKEAVLLKGYKQLEVQASKKASENEVLANRLAVIEGQLAERRGVAGSECSEVLKVRKGERTAVVGGGGKIITNETDVQAATKQFNEAKQSRVLLDTAKRHTEEIEFLRKELDVLRQRTFPSFIQKNNKSCPDQK